MVINEKILIKVCKGFSLNCEASDVDIAFNYNKLVNKDDKVDVDDVEEFLTCELEYEVTQDRVREVKDEVSEYLELLDFDSAISEIENLDEANEENYFRNGKLVSYQDIIDDLG